jgi:hypothetical protein
LDIKVCAILYLINDSFSFAKVNRLNVKDHDVIVKIVMKDELVLEDSEFFRSLQKMAIKINSLGFNMPMDRNTMLIY